MRAKIGKKTREQAALICAIAASNRDCNEKYGLVALHLGLRWDESYGVACSAWRHVIDHGYSNLYTHEQPDAEAEALLRSGWSPS